MKLLFDQNLSFRLVSRLASLYPDSAHVRYLGLGEADDIQVWSYAESHAFVIVSKDADFYELSLRLGHPPKIISVRRGNCHTDEIETILRSHHEDLLAFEQDLESGSLVIF